MRSVDIKMKGQELTTAPKVHLSNKQTIAELKFLFDMPLTRKSSS